MQKKFGLQSLKYSLNMNIIKRIFWQSWTHKYTLIPAFILTIICSLSKVVFPYTVGNLAAYLKIENPNDTSILLSQVKKVFIMMLISKVTHLIKKLYVNVLSMMVIKDLRNQFYQALMEKDIEFYDLHITSDLFGILTGDIAELKNVTIIQFAEAIKKTIEIIGSIGAMIYISYRLFLLFIFILPIAGVLLYVSELQKQSFNDQLHKQQNKSHNIALESLENIRIVKTFSTEEKEVKKYYNTLEEMFNLELNLDIKGSVFQCVSSILYFTGILAVIVFGINVFKYQTLTINQMGGFGLYGYFLFGNIINFSELFRTVSKSMFLAEKIFNIIDSKPKINYKIEDEKKLDKNIEGNISFKNVDFVYPAKLDAVVLKNINFSIKKGQTIGIVGTSGSGKSTIVNLMERLYDIEKTNDSDKGIFFDDINVKNFNLKNLHSQIGYVQQEPSLFNGTILDNITYGVENYSMEEINDVIYKSKSEFINDKKLFPKGLQTNVGERGSQLSGGQKQRIAIARALIKKPKILILDEATSALDSENEYKFQQELNMLNKDITIIIIAHRLSTIKNCDQIIVMNNGEIKQIGNHNKLIRTNGEYKHLMEQQISSGIIKN